MFNESNFNSSSFLEKLDLFGININIRFCKKVLHQTQIGGLITIFIFILLLFQINLIINNVLDSQNPTVLYQQSYTFEPERFNLTSDKFSLAFGIQNGQSQHFIDPSVYNVYVEFRKLTRVFNTTTNDYTVSWDIRQLKTVTCTKDQFQVKGTEEYFSLIKFSQLYCIDQNEKDLYIEGQFDTNKFASIKIYVEVCSTNSTTTKGSKCKSDKELIDQLQSNRFAVYYVDNTVLTRNKKQPIHAQGKQSFWQSSFAFQKSLSIQFRNSYIYTDNGLIIEDINVERALTFSNDREQLIQRSGNYIYDCTIQFEKNTNSEYHRSYAKIDKALSQIGGIYQVLFALGCLLCKPLSQLELNRKLMDSLFSFVNSDESNQTDSITKEEIKQYQDSSELQNYNLQQGNLEDNTNNNLSKSKIIISKNDSKKNNLTSSHDESLRRSQFQFQRKSSFLLEKQRSNPEISFISKFQDKQIEGSSEIKLCQFSKLKTLLDKEKSITQSYSPINKKDPSTQETNQYLKNRKNNKQQNIIMDRVKSNVQILKDIFHSNFKEIKFKTKEYILSNWKLFYMCRKRKHMLLNEGIDKLYQHIDIFYITTKLIEFEKLKHLILNKEQLQLFEFIPRPILEFGSKNSCEFRNKIIYEDKRNLYDKTLDAQEAFNKIIDKGEVMANIDKKLIEMLHPKLKSLFQFDQTTENKEIESNDIIPDDGNESQIQKNEVKDFYQVQMFKQN